MIISVEDLPSYLFAPCLRCARRESDVDFAQLYGTRGQDQAGIDLYARLSNGTYRVYQCKNEGDFGPAKIRAAVQKFRNGKWSATAKELVLCTRESLRSTLRGDELEAQAQSLAAGGISLLAWDRDALNDLSRGCPVIVDDFFGRART